MDLTDEKLTENPENGVPADCESASSSENIEVKDDGTAHDESLKDNILLAAQLLHESGQGTSPSSSNVIQTDSPKLGTNINKQSLDGVFPTISRSITKDLPHLPSIEEGINEDDVDACPNSLDTSVSLSSSSLSSSTNLLPGCVAVHAVSSRPTLTSISEEPQIASGSMDNSDNLLCAWRADDVDDESNESQEQDEYAIGGCDDTMQAGDSDFVMVERNEVVNLPDAIEFGCLAPTVEGSGDVPKLADGNIGPEDIPQICEKSADSFGGEGDLAVSDRLKDTHPLPYQADIVVNLLIRDLTPESNAGLPDETANLPLQNTDNTEANAHAENIDATIESATQNDANQTNEAHADNLVTAEETANERLQTIDSMIKINTAEEDNNDEFTEYTIKSDDNSAEHKTIWGVGEDRLECDIGRELLISQVNQEGMELQNTDNTVQIENGTVIEEQNCDFEQNDSMIQPRDLEETKEHCDDSEAITSEETRKVSDERPVSIICEVRATLESLDAEIDATFGSLIQAPSTETPIKSNVDADQETQKCPNEETPLPAKAKGSGSESKLADTTSSSCDISAARESHSEYTVSSSNSERQVKENSEKDGQKQRDKDKEKRKKDRAGVEEGSTGGGLKECLKNAVGDVCDRAVSKTDSDMVGSFSCEIRGPDVKSTCRLEFQTTGSASDDFRRGENSTERFTLQEVPGMPNHELDSVHDSDSVSESSKQSGRSGKRKRRKRTKKNNRNKTSPSDPVVSNDGEPDSLDASGANDSSLSGSHTDVPASSENSERCECKINILVNEEQLQETNEKVLEEEKDTLVNSKNLKPSHSTELAVGVEESTDKNLLEEPTEKEEMLIAASELIPPTEMEGIGSNHNLSDVKEHALNEYQIVNDNLNDIEIEKENDFTYLDEKNGTIHCGPITIIVHPPSPIPFDGNEHAECDMKNNELASDIDEQKDTLQDDTKQTEDNIQDIEVLTNTANETSNGVQNEGGQDQYQPELGDDIEKPCDVPHTRLELDEDAVFEVKESDMHSHEMSLKDDDVASASVEGTDENAIVDANEMTGYENEKLTNDENPNDILIDPSTTVTAERESASDGEGIKNDKELGKEDVSDGAEQYFGIERNDFNEEDGVEPQDDTEMEKAIESQPPTLELTTNTNETTQCDHGDEFNDAAKETKHTMAYDHQVDETELSENPDGVTIHGEILPTNKENDISKTTQDELENMRQEIERLRASFDENEENLVGITERIGAIHELLAPFGDKDDTDMNEECQLTEGEKINDNEDSIRVSLSPENEKERIVNEERENVDCKMLKKEYTQDVDCVFEDSKYQSKNGNDLIENVDEINQEPEHVTEEVNNESSDIGTTHHIENKTKATNNAVNESPYNDTPYLDVTKVCVNQEYDNEENDTLVNNVFTPKAEEAESDPEGEKDELISQDDEKDGGDSLAVELGEQVVNCDAMSEIADDTFEFRAQMEVHSNENTEEKEILCQTEVKLLEKDTLEWTPDKRAPVAAIEANPRNASNEEHNNIESNIMLQEEISDVVVCASIDVDKINTTLSNIQKENEEIYENVEGKIVASENTMTNIEEAHSLVSADQQNGIASIEEDRISLGDDGVATANIGKTDEIDFEAKERAEYEIAVKHQFDSSDRSLIESVEESIEDVHDLDLTNYVHRPEVIGVCDEKIEDSDAWDNASRDAENKTCSSDPEIHVIPQINVEVESSIAEEPEIQTTNHDEFNSYRPRAFETDLQYTPHNGKGRDELRLPMNKEHQGWISDTGICKLTIDENENVSLGVNSSENVDAESTVPLSYVQENSLDQHFDNAPETRTTENLALSVKPHCSTSDIKFHEKEENLKEQSNAIMSQSGCGEYIVDTEDAPLTKLNLVDDTADFGDYDYTPNDLAISDELAIGYTREKLDNSIEIVEQLSTACQNEKDFLNPCTEIICIKPPCNHQEFTPMIPSTDNETNTEESVRKENTPSYVKTDTDNDDECSYEKPKRAAQPMARDVSREAEIEREDSDHKNVIDQIKCEVHKDETNIFVEHETSQSDSETYSEILSEPLSNTGTDETEMEVKHQYQEIPTPEHEIADKVERSSNDFQQVAEGEEEKSMPGDEARSSTDSSANMISNDNISSGQFKDQILEPLLADESQEDGSDDKVQRIASSGDENTLKKVETDEELVSFKNEFQQNGVSERNIEEEREKSPVNSPDLAVGATEKTSEILISEGFEATSDESKCRDAANTEMEPESKQEERVSDKGEGCPCENHACEAVESDKSGDEAPGKESSTHTADAEDYSMAEELPFSSKPSHEEFPINEQPGTSKIAFSVGPNRLVIPRKPRTDSVNQTAKKKDESSSVKARPKKKPLWRKVMARLRHAGVSRRTSTKASRKRHLSGSSNPHDKGGSDALLEATCSMDDETENEDDRWKTIDREEYKALSKEKRKNSNLSTTQRSYLKRIRRLHKLRNGAEMAFTAAHSSSQIPQEAPGCKGKTRKRRSDLLLHGHLKDVDLSHQRPATDQVFEVFCDQKSGQQKDVSDLAGSLANKETPSVQLLMKPLMSGMAAQTSQAQHAPTETAGASRDKTTEVVSNKSKSAKRMGCLLM